MQNLLLFSNQVDGAFFGICIAVVAIIVAIYFLIPVIYRKQYQEQRENLKKREEAFKLNKQNKENSEEVAVEQVAEDSKSDGAKVLTINSL